MIALERSNRRVFAVLATALEDGDRIIVPATVLAQVIRNPARQVRLWRLIQHDRTEVIPLDVAHAQAIGVLLAQTKTADITDAHVAVCAQRTVLAVITSDPFDLRRLDPTLGIVAV